MILTWHIQHDFSEYWALCVSKSSRFLFSDDIQPSISLDRTELRMVRIWERHLVFPVFRVYSYTATMPWVLKRKNTKYFFFFRKLMFSISPSRTLSYFENSAAVLSWNQPCGETPVPWGHTLSWAGFFVPLWPFKQSPALLSFVSSQNQQVPVGNRVSLSAF